MVPSWSEELESPFFWRAVLSELIGTFLHIFLCCGSCTGWLDGPPSVVQLALTAGLSVASIVWCLGNVSGAYINPAVTWSKFITRRISLPRAVLFLLAQCVGAVTGAATLKAITPTHAHGVLGVNTLNPDVTPWHGFVMEVVVTFVLVLTVFSTGDTARTDMKGSGPLAVGLSVTLCNLVAIKYTGSSMNPARTFGPAAVQGNWDNHWIYWCGPLLGGSMASLLYDNVFSANASVTKTKAYLRDKNYTPGEHYKRPEKSADLKGEEAEACL